MKLLLFAGSLRKGSLNRKLLANANDFLVSQNGIETTVADLTPLDIPMYNGDVEAKGIPEGVMKLAALVQSHQGIVISSPENNGAIAGVLKNTLDWVSRIKPMPWKGKPLLLLAASPGWLGGTRGLWHGRVPFEVMGSYVYPDMFSLPKADEAFDENGKLKDSKTMERLTNLLAAFITFAQKNS